MRIPLPARESVRVFRRVFTATLSIVSLSVVATCMGCDECADSEVASVPRGEQAKAGIGTRRGSYPISDAALAHGRDPNAWSGCTAAEKEISRRTEAAHPPKFASAEDLWSYAMSAAESFESDPTKLIVLFNPGDRSNLVAYWVTLHSLARLEREFDQRASAGRWREITDDYQQERLIAATIPQIHMLLSRFRDLRLRLRPKDAPVIATADDPATGIYVLGITAVDESLQLHLTQFHSKACGVDTNQEGSKPCGRPFVLVGNGWKIPSFAFLDDAWTMVSEGSLDAAELSVRMRDLIERHGNGYSGAAIARFPPGVDGLLMDWWLEQHPPASGSGWGGGNAKRYNPFNIWNPVGPTKDPLLNGVIGR